MSSDFPVIAGGLDALLLAEANAISKRSWEAFDGRRRASSVGPDNQRRPALSRDSDVNPFHGPKSQNRDPIVRGLISEELSELGYAVLEAAQGAKALEILQSKLRVDLLVTDLGLPGVNGRQIVQLGRKGRPTLKVLYMTGYAESARAPEASTNPAWKTNANPSLWRRLQSGSAP